MNRKVSDACSHTHTQKLESNITVGCGFWSDYTSDRNHHIWSMETYEMTSPFLSSDLVLWICVSH